MQPGRKRHPLSAAFGEMPLSEFVELVRNINDNGLLTAITTASDGSILDGWHRYRACILAGVKPRFEPFNYVVEAAAEGAGRTMSEAEFVVAQNAHRRHLSQEQRRSVIAELLKASPTMSNRALAGMAKVDHKTVASMRREAEATGSIPQLARTTGKDGKARPAKVTKPRLQNLDVTDIEFRDIAPLTAPAPAETSGTPATAPTKPAGEPQHKVPAAPVAVAAAPAAKPRTHVHWKSAADRERAYKVLGAGVAALRLAARDIHFIKLTKVATARAKLMAAVAELDRMLSEVQQ
ncbi:MAG: ParB/RepB/Spo0J family partition protein [Rubrivivax sp.]|nr:ParB/RepB/Spo0J family partition protein [Rubrivivax sp.]